MDRTIQRTGFVNALTLLLMGVALAVIRQYSPSIVTDAALAFQVIGFLVGAVSWFQMRLEMQEEAERLELEDLARSRSQSALFASSEADNFPARRSREQFERWMIPFFTILLFLFQGAAVYWLYRRLEKWESVPNSKALLSAAMLAGVALLQLLLGLYSAKLARYANLRLLRPGGASLLMGFLVASAAVVTESLDYAGYPVWDRHVGWLMLGVLGIVAVETLLALVFEAYRPRVKGRESRLIYESRLIGLLGQPTGLFETAAHALDYQFGFKVSETWFFQFLQQAIAKILLAQLGLLLLLTCFVVIEPGEQALLERFGRPVAGREVLDPGFHLKFPWPVDLVHRYDTRRIQSFNIGFIPDENLEKDNTLLWTRSHYKEEFNMLVASREQLTVTNDTDQTVPVNLLTVSIPVQFTVKDIRSWAYRHSNPAGLLERIANREVVRYLASVDIEHVMSTGRQEAAQELRRRIGEQAELAGLGVEIVFIGLQDIHPPLGNKQYQVAGSYEQVIGAEQEREAKILEAEGYAFETLPTAQASQARIVHEAHAAAATKVADAQGRAGQFANQLLAYRTSPEVYTARNYLETLARSSAGSRKYVVLPQNTREVFTLNLEDKIRRDLLDVPDPTKGAREEKK